MAATATTTTKMEKEVTLKLLVNKDTNKVLFAEADNEFVDVLFSFLTLPLGTIARLVEKESSIGSVTIGCLNSLYHCVEDLDDGCIGTRACKEMLLQPMNASESYLSSLKLNIDDTEPTKYFTCTKSSMCDERRLCNSFNKFYCCCGRPFIHSVLVKHFHNGFVNDGATFIITDDLTVFPNSMDFTNFRLLQSFGIKSLSSVKEMTVSVTKQKVLDLLKYSLFSKTPLTDLYLGKAKLSTERSIFFACDVESNNNNIQVTLKLVIRKSDNKLLYAQGEHDFADIIFSFLAFPLGGVARIFGGNCSLGSIDSLHKSIVELDEVKYFSSNEAKKRIVDPCLVQQYSFLSKKILPYGKSLVYYCYYQNQLKKKIEGLSRWQMIVSDQRIPGEPVYVEAHSFIPESSTVNEGYVKGPRIYVVTDDLVIAPLSPITLLHLINRFETPFEDLKEKVVTIGVKECLSILKAALTSTSALSNGLAHLLTEVKEEICENNLRYM